MLRMYRGRMDLGLVAGEFASPMLHGLHYQG
ncbi:unnamed protein product, partial [Vitis vinifera]